jgi:predicted GIY-YIG superfamily endonuclease
MSYACYCLVSTTGKTYVGFSTNVDRRLRQHNGEIQGGARATHGGSWKRICTIAGFPTQQSALQFEWKWKHCTRKAKGGSAVERRCEALLKLLNLEQSTSKAVPFANYEGPLMVLSEDELVKSYLENKDLGYGILVE